MKRLERLLREKSELISKEMDEMEDALYKEEPEQKLTQEGSEEDSEQDETIKELEGLEGPCI